MVVNMAGEGKVLRKRKSSSSRPRSRGISSCSHGDYTQNDTSIHQIEKYTESHGRNTKSVLFQDKVVLRNNLPSELTNGNHERLPHTSPGRRNRLTSAKSETSNGRRVGIKSESDSVPRLPLNQRRSVSAHPTLRTHPSTSHPTQPTPSLVRTSSKSGFNLNSSLGDDQTAAFFRSSIRSRQRVERLKMRSSSVDSSDSDDYYSPRTSSRSVSQPLSPEVLASMTSQAQLTRQAWDVFSNHVKLIDDSTGMISRYPRKTFASSSVFQKTMHELCGYTEYGKSRGFMKLKGKVGAIATCASRLLAGAKRANAEKENEEEEEEKEDETMPEVIVSKETVENAKRGWRILRQYVQEMAAEKRMSQSNLTWNMLTHTIRGLSNMERTRYELYKKYGLVPTVLSDGTVIQENTMLSERARAALAAKAHNKPSTAVPSARHHSASMTHRNQTYKAIGGFKSGRVNTAVM